MSTANLLSSLLKDHSNSGRSSSLFSKDVFRMTQTERCLSTDKRSPTASAGPKMIPLFKMVHQLTRKIQKYNYFFFCRLQDISKKCSNLDINPVVEPIKQQPGTRFSRSKETTSKCLDLLADFVQIFDHKQIQNRKQTAFKRLANHSLQLKEANHIGQVLRKCEKRHISQGFFSIKRHQKCIIKSQILFSTLSNIAWKKIRESMETINIYSTKMVIFQPNLKTVESQIQMLNDQFSETSEDLSETLKYLYEATKGRTQEMNNTRRRNMDKYAGIEMNISTFTRNKKPTAAKPCVTEIFSKPMTVRSSYCYEEMLIKIPEEISSRAELLSKPNHLYPELQSEMLPDLNDNYHLFNGLSFKDPKPSAQFFSEPEKKDLRNNFSTQLSQRAPFKDIQTKNNSVESKYRENINLISSLQMKKSVQKRNIASQLDKSSSSKVIKTPNSKGKYRLDMDFKPINQFTTKPVNSNSQSSLSKQNWQSDNKATHCRKNESQKPKIDVHLWNKINCTPFDDNQYKENDHKIEKSASQKSCNRKELQIKTAKKMRIEIENIIHNNQKGTKNPKRQNQSSKRLVNLIL